MTVYSAGIIGLVIATTTAAPAYAGELDDAYASARRDLVDWKDRIARYGEELAVADGFASVDEAIAADIGEPFRVFLLTYDKLASEPWKHMQLYMYSFPIITRDGETKRMIGIVRDEDGKILDGGAGGGMSPAARLALSNALRQQVPEAEVGVLILDNRYHFTFARTDDMLYLAAPTEKEAVPLGLHELNTLTPVDRLAPGIARYVDRQIRTPEGNPGSFDFWPYLSSPNPLAASRWILSAAESAGVDIDRRLSTRRTPDADGILVPIGHAIDRGDAQASFAVLVDGLSNMGVDTLLTCLIETTEFPTIREWSQLLKTGSSVYSKCFGMVFIGRIPLDSVDSVESLPFVRFVAEYKPEYKFRSLTGFSDNCFVVIQSLIGDQQRCREDLIQLGLTEVTWLGYYSAMVTRADIPKIARLWWVRVVIREITGDMFERPSPPSGGEEL
jgi:hypothetical protein